MSKIYEYMLPSPEYEEKFENDRRVRKSEVYYAKRDAYKRNTISHYTNVESLLKILSNRCWKFNRIDKVNDRTEKYGVRNKTLIDRIFVACFDKTQTESIPLWFIYTQKGQGVKIQLKFKSNQIVWNFIDKSRLAYVNGEKYELGGDGQLRFEMHDIVYNDSKQDEEQIFLNDDEEYIYIDELAIHKNEAWGYENETRMIMVATEELANEWSAPESILVPVDFSNIESVRIIFDPWMCDEMKECIRCFAEKHLKKYTDLKLIFQDSVFTGKIDR